MGTRVAVLGVERTFETSDREALEWQGRFLELGPDSGILFYCQVQLISRKFTAKSIFSSTNILFKSLFFILFFVNFLSIFCYIIYS